LFTREKSEEKSILKGEKKRAGGRGGFFLYKKGLLISGKRKEKIDDLYEGGAWGKKGERAQRMHVSPVQRKIWGLIEGGVIHRAKGQTFYDMRGNYNIDYCIKREERTSCCFMEEILTKEAFITGGSYPY